jgi:predicted CXXCH cytochrome family protein
MIKKGSKLYSILTGACPKCHQESMYSNKNPYVLKDVIKINETCSHCHTKYRIEPSFFYGSMYVSYAVGIAFAVAAFVISYVFLGSSLMISFIAIIGTLFVFAPIIMRLSRNIWINLFMHFDKSLVKKKTD